MNNKYILQQRLFRLLSEYSQRKVSASELEEAIEELAIHVANFCINEQNYGVLLRYFSFVLSARNRGERDCLLVHCCSCSGYLIRHSIRRISVFKSPIASSTKCK